MSEPITHGGTDRGYKLCQCNQCKIVMKCTPRTDFYTIGSDTSGPLYCERCFWEMVRKNLIKTNENTRRPN